jgi:hypothetical protein
MSSFIPHLEINIIHAILELLKLLTADSTCANSDFKVSNTSREKILGL